jgi:A/G-specific adenine glycosylase
MNRAKISDHVLHWYDLHKRDLPWRYTQGQTAAPYRVWLSEMMLQQTQVETVIPYFQRFVSKWPTVHDLANADLDEVLHQWQGLGYYARARNLHKCAQIISETKGGAFPSTPIELQALPGIGLYASAAIAAIAFNTPATVVDGNVARIVSRLFGFLTPIKHNQTAIYKAAASATPSQRPGDYAQALMDIGSSICTPRSPKCNECPLKHGCKAYASGTPEAYPNRPFKTTIPTRYAVSFRCIQDDKILLRKRSHQRMLNGLWELPGSDWYADSLPELPEVSGTYRDVKHTFSHFHLITRVITTPLIEDEFLDGSERFQPLTTLDQLALSTLTKKLLKPAQFFN